MKKSTHFLGGILGYLGAVTSVVAYVAYGAYLLRGEADTNIITWGLWSLEVVLSFRIYKKQTNNDFAMYVEELVASIGCCVITTVLITRAYVAGANLLGPVEWVDGISVLLFVIVFRIYRRSLKFNDVWPATLAFQGVIIFSALPLARSTFEHPSNEPFWPWVLWATGFTLQFFCVLLRKNGKHGYRALLTPLNYMFWHGLIVGIIYFNVAP